MYDCWYTVEEYTQYTPQFIANIKITALGQHQIND